MDQDRPLARGGNFKLLHQTGTLHIMRRALVVVVEADLPAGNHFRLRQQPIQLSEHRLVNLRACCADTHPRLHRAAARFGLPVELAANLERLLHLLRPLADADGQHRPTPASHARASIAARSSA